MPRCQWPGSLRGSISMARSKSSIDCVDAAGLEVGRAAAVEHVGGLEAEVDGARVAVDCSVKIPAAIGGGTFKQALPSRIADGAGDAAAAQGEATSKRARRVTLTMMRKRIDAAVASSLIGVAGGSGAGKIHSGAAVSPPPWTLRSFLWTSTIATSAHLAVGRGP